MNEYASWRSRQRLKFEGIRLTYLGSAKFMSIINSNDMRIEQFKSPARCIYTYMCKAYKIVKTI